ncbi:hypothetical protein CHH83_02070 [Bacillus sp. 7586-K]|nr:hypothetical protein CHH83_02070 [Bacillus sp. 7586-K]
MSKYSPVEISYRGHAKEQADLIFEKVTEGIFKITKDRKGIYYGTSFIGVDEVLDSLNNCLKCLVISSDEIHKNF